jgi:hypothetical protein
MTLELRERRGWWAAAMKVAVDQEACGQDGCGIERREMARKWIKFGGGGLGVN